MWWRIHAIRTPHLLHSLQGLQLCSGCLDNTWRCWCLSPAGCHILPLRCCYISDAALSPYMFRFEILSLNTIQSSLWIHCLPLHLLCHYVILQVRNTLSYLHTLGYYALSPPHVALIHHRLAMILPPHPHPHCHHPSPHTPQHHWFPGETSRVQSQPIVASSRWGWHRTRHCHHLHLHKACFPLASRNEDHHPYNFDYRDVSVSACDHALLKRHFGRQMVKKNSIIHTRCFHADDPSWWWVLRPLDMMIDCSKSVFIHPLLVALRSCVPGIYHESICVFNASRGEELATRRSAAGCVLTTVILVLKVVGAIRSVCFQL